MVSGVNVDAVVDVDAGLMPRFDHPRPPSFHAMSPTYPSAVPNTLRYLSHASTLPCIKMTTRNLANVLLVSIRRSVLRKTVV